MIKSRTVITNYKANTDDHERGIGRISDRYRQLADAEARAGREREKQNKSAIDGLAKFALSVEGAKKAVEIANKGLEAYAKTSKEAADEVKRIQDTAKQAFDGVMASIGRSVAALEPLINGFARLVNLLNEAGLAGPAAIGALGFAITGNPVVAGILGITTASIQQYGRGASSQVGGWVMGAVNGTNQVRDPFAPQVVRTTGRPFDGGTNEDAINRSVGLQLERFRQNLPDLVALGIGRLAGIDQWSGPFRARASGPYDREAALRRNFGARTTDFDFEATGTGGVGIAAQTSDFFSIDTDAALRGTMTNRWRGELDYYRQRGADAKSQLEQTFGPLEQFNAYTTAFNTLAGASSAALTAWIDGSKSAGEAFKAFIGQALTGLASQLLAEGIKYELYALGSLIPGPFFNPAAAAGYASTGAAFLAGSGTVALIARGLGGGQGLPASSGSVGAGGGASGGGSYVPYMGAAQSGPTIMAPIVVSDPFAYDSSRSRQRTARRWVADALQTSAGAYG